MQLCRRIPEYESISIWTWQIWRRRGDTRTYIATADILDKLRVDFRLLDDLLEQRVDEVIELGVFESTLKALGKWCSDRESDHYIVGILGGSVMNVGMCYDDGWRGYLH
jgi:hypothetical protein